MFAVKTGYLLGGKRPHTRPGNKTGRNNSRHFSKALRNGTAVHHKTSGILGENFWAEEFEVNDATSVKAEGKRKCSELGVIEWVGLNRTCGLGSNLPPSPSASGAWVPL